MRSERRWCAIYTYLCIYWKGVDSCDCPHIRRNPKGSFVLNGRRNSAYPGGPITGYYRVPCGFKLSRYVRVPRELLVLPNGIAHLPFAYISGTSQHRRIFYPPCHHVLRPSIVYGLGQDNASLFVQGVRHLPVYGRTDVFQRLLARCNISCAHGLTWTTSRPAKTHTPRLVSEILCIRAQD